LKLPFDFGIRFVLRLVAPGALLAGISLPAVKALAPLLYPGLSDLLLFVTSGLVFGFALLLLDMPIYMLLEGRRFWPAWLRNWALRRESERLDRLLRKSAASAEPMRTEYDILAAQYPLDGSTGAPSARYPTRLGNLLTSFETYPTVKYGLDGVFFWPRLWVAIDKDLREELDSAQAVVDGAIYTCFAFGVGVIVCLGYWIAGLSAVWWHWPAGALACLILSRIFYLVALPRYAQYGELFAAVFDQHRDKLKLGTLLTDLDAHSGQPGSVTRTEREKWRAAWRFLRWHRYRAPGATANQDVQGW
jgi:hypothetical protein